MARIETWHRCPVCNQPYGDQRGAVRCRNQHQLIVETWAVGRYKSVRVYENHAPDSMYGVNTALREADLSDNIEERKRQLAEMKGGTSQ